MSWRYPVPDHVRAAATDPRHSALLAAIVASASWTRPEPQERSPRQ